MPAFCEDQGTADTDTWEVVLFIDHLPQLTKNELKENGEPSLEQTKNDAKKVKSRISCKERSS
jgi:hypothetical protein